MANKYGLSDEELGLLKFIVKYQNELSDTFTPHDVSCIGYVASATCYKNLYDKGFLNKPEKGRFAINNAGIKLASKKSILWWITVGWIWMLYKWLVFMPIKSVFYTFPKWVFSMVRQVIQTSKQ